MMSSIVPVAIGILACLVCSAFCSMAEMTYSSCSVLRLEKMKDMGYQRASVAYYITQHFDAALSAILIGNNLANISSSSLASVFVILLVGQELADSYAWVATAVMTILVIIFGETIPKINAKKNCNRYALKWAYVVRALMIILYPVVWIVVMLINLLTLPIKDKGTAPSEEEAVEELQNIIETAEDENVLDQDRTELIQSAIDFSDVLAYEVMTPRIDVTAIDIDDDYADILKTVENSSYSRIPVYKGSIDNIIGVLYLNHFLRAMAESDGKPLDISTMLMEPVYVYKTTKVADVLNKLKKARQHLGIVTDEYGGTLGVVTMEDILETIVGDIWDDDDEVYEEEIVRREEGGFELDGDMTISDFLDLINVREDDFDFESDTVGGWVTELAGEFPAEGNVYEYNNIQVTVLKMDGRRVEKVLINV